MRRTLFVVMALALPLGAQDSKATGKPVTTAEEKSVPAATVGQNAVAQGDSPLVAASKRANRKGKKPSNVITNETLKRSPTSSTNEVALPLPVVPPPRPTPEMEAVAAENARRAEAASEAAAKATAGAGADAQRKMAREAAAAEEGSEGAADEYVGAAPPPPL